MCISLRAAQANIIIQWENHLVLKVILHIEIFPVFLACTIWSKTQPLDENLSAMWSGGHIHLRIKDGEGGDEGWLLNTFSGKGSMMVVKAQW